MKPSGRFVHKVCNMSVVVFNSSTSISIVPTHRLPIVLKTVSMIHNARKYHQNCGRVERPLKVKKCLKPYLTLATKSEAGIGFAFMPVNWFSRKLNHAKCKVSTVFSARRRGSQEGSLGKCGEKGVSDGLV